MQVLYARCAGLDVHCKMVSVCVSVCESQARKCQKVRVFSTFTRDLLEMAEWLKQEGVTHVRWRLQGFTGGLYGQCWRISSNRCWSTLNT